MITLNQQTHEFVGLCQGIAVELRAWALAVDADPADPRPTRELLQDNASTATLLRSVCIPKRFRSVDVPACTDLYTESCLARVAGNIELARGDASVLNSITGPSLAGLAVDALGDDAQQETFYRAVTDQGIWTFFAMTEAEHGSDATAIQTRLDADGNGDYRMNGGKRYVSNASRGSLGVVFARTGSNALTMRAALVHQPAAGLSSRPLEMFGMRGARIGEMTFENLHVPADAVLGRHLPASKRGLWGAGKAFNVMRVQVAAQALGIGFAIHDTVSELRPGASGRHTVAAELEAARQVLFEAAEAVDHRPTERRWPAVAKLNATTLAVRVAQWAEDAVGAGGLLENPLLEKWCRDVRAYEFMDGTTNVLRLHIASELPRGKVA